MYFINNPVPYLGLVICLYALLSHKVCTASKVNVFNFAIFLLIWLLLASADLTDFKPVIWTVICRCLILVVAINIVIKNHATSNAA
jgi:hypothetical protein